MDDGFVDWIGKLGVSERPFDAREGSFPADVATAWVTGPIDRTILHSSWIAYLNITARNP